LTPFIVKTLVDELGINEPEIHPSLRSRPDFHTLPFAAVKLANQNMMGPDQRLEFMAKRLLDSDRDLKPDERQSVIQGPTRVLIGTPLYVAIAD
jgi:hypothetical protein